MKKSVILQFNIHENECLYPCFWVQVYFKLEVSDLDNELFLFLVTLHSLEKIVNCTSCQQLLVTVKFQNCMAALVLIIKFGHRMFSFLLSSPHEQLGKKCFEDILP